MLYLIFRLLGQFTSQCFGVLENEIKVLVVKR